MIILKTEGNEDLTNAYYRCPAQLDQLCKYYLKKSRKLGCEK